MKISRHEHYFVRQPHSKKKEYKFKSSVDGVVVDFVTASGIFSPRQMDLGSLTLIKFMQIKSGQRVLDFGAGYGAIGIYAALFYPKSEVVMVDINERAVGCAKENVEINEVKNAKVKQSHFYSGLKGEYFDVILTNPPISAGMDTCYKIIEGAKEHLYPKGSLQLVAKHQKGGRRLMEKMEEVFGNVESIGSKGGYRVYKSVLQD